MRSASSATIICCGPLGGVVSVVGYTTDAADQWMLRRQAVLIPRGRPTLARCPSGRAQDASRRTRRPCDGCRPQTACCTTGGPLQSAGTRVMRSRSAATAGCRGVRMRQGPPQRSRGARSPADRLERARKSSSRRQPIAGTGERQRQSQTMGDGTCCASQCPQIPEN